MATENEVKDIEVVEKPDGSLIVDPPKNEPAEEESGSDDRLSASDDDEHPADGESDDEAEERKERNRARRSQNKENRKNYIESLKRELASRDSVINELSTRVASVERQGVGSQMAQIDSAMREAEQYYNHFKSTNQRAIELADGAAAVDAQEKMFAAQQRYNMLKNAKANMHQQAQAPRPLDPRLKANAESWMERNSWYDASGEDQDSDVVLRLDQRLTAEGWNPTTSEYWEELDARVKKYLPHRANSGYNRPKVGARVPVAGASQGSSQSKGGYVLSAERVKALKDAGIYEDPKALAEAIKRYQNFDKDNANG